MQAGPQDQKKGIFAVPLAGRSVSHAGTSAWFPVCQGVGRLWLHLLMSTTVFKSL